MAAMTWMLCPAYSQTNADATAAPVVQPPTASAPAGMPAVPLRSSVAEVVKLSAAGMGDDLVVAFVNGSRSQFNLTAGEIIQLKKQGVSMTAITAMLNHDIALQNSNPTTQANSNKGQPGVSSNQDAVVYQAQSAPDSGVVSQAPPPQVEYVTVAPGPDYYWYPGYWGWNNGWVWSGGYWGFRGGYGLGGYRGWSGYRGGYGFHGSTGFHGGGGFHGGNSFRSGGSHGGGGHH